MRYTPEHKANTRQRIIEEAARMFRRDGVAATGLQPLMKTLGLTHGGFYAHFTSKDELVETALQYAVEQLQGSVAQDMADSAPLPTFISHYLSSVHRADPGAGCPLPTLSAELGQRGQPSATTDRLVADRLAMLESGLAGEGAAEQSVLMLCAMVGALSLSRSVSDPQLSDLLLKTTRRLLVAQARDRTAG